MTDFNSMPLSEQLKALQAGDELHLRGGGWLPFVEYIEFTNRLFPIRGKEMSWTIVGNYTEEGDVKDLDIIRVVRPGERKVPEIGSKLKEMAFPTSPEQLCVYFGIAMNLLADHFEAEARK